MSYLVQLLILALFWSCGRQAGESKKIIPIPVSEVPAFLRAQQIECSPVEGNICPEGLARIFVVNQENPEESSMCTGFLISPSRIITNHHCISSQEQCASTYFSVYSTDRNITRRCSRVIAAQDDGPILEAKSVDYAVLELDQEIHLAQYFDRPSGSLRLGEPVTAWVVDHIGIKQARITELNCKFRRKINSLELKNCPAIMGNSGSPVINTDHELVGVLWGTTYDSRITEDTPLELRRIFQIFSFVTEVDHFQSFMQ
jgi:S1-C subfamily serine protease